MYSTVFQAELVAILLAARHVLHEGRSLRPRYIKIFSDSQSAVAALVARRSSCRTVRDTISALNDLAAICNTVRLVWVPSHTGILGNERANSLAKLGMAADAAEPPYLPLRPLSSSRAAVSHAIMETWSTNWTTYSGGRMTKDFLPHPNPSRVRPLLALDRILPSLLATIIFVTTAVSGNPTLRISVASATYLERPRRTFMRSVPCFATLRFNTTGLFTLPCLSTSWTVDQLVSFLQHTSISAAMDDPTPYTLLLNTTGRTWTPTHLKLIWTPPPPQ